MPNRLTKPCDVSFDGMHAWFTRSALCWCGPLNSRQGLHVWTTETMHVLCLVLGGRASLGAAEPYAGDFYALKTT